MKRNELDFDEVLQSMRDDADGNLEQLELVEEWIQMLRDWKEAYNKGDCQ